MSIWAIIVTFICVWWVVIFTVLPWGNKRDEEAAQKGFANSAPQVHNIPKKMLITTGIAIFITGLIYILVEVDVISFRDMVQEWE